MGYPSSKDELNSMIDKFLVGKASAKQIHGIIIPHAGYIFSGEVAGKAYSLLKGKEIKKICILAPSHYAYFSYVVSGDNLSTVLGEVKVIKNKFPQNNSLLKKEHSLDVQLPFIQKLFPEAEVLPLIIGELDSKKAEKLAEELAKENYFFIISSDLSHFQPYNKAKEIDKRTISIIENIDFSYFEALDACGKFPLLVLFYLCKLKGWKPRLIEYKNSGDITGEKDSVVGYSSFYF